MTWSPIVPAGQKPPAAPYSLGAKSVGGWVHTAGLVSIDAEGNNLWPNDIRKQTRHVLETIAKIIEAAGGNLRDVVSIQIFLRDFADYGPMNEVYKEVFEGLPLPPRYCVRTDLVRDEWLVEMAAIARVDQDDD